MPKPTDAMPDDEAFVFTFEMPARRDDCPPPSSKTTRRLDAADGEHWFEVRGGGTQVEGAYLSWHNEKLGGAARKHRAGEIDDDALEAASVAYNAALATFIADRVVAHNLTDDDGEPLPLGLALFWAMPGRDALTLAVRIQARTSIWSDPKAEASSMTG